MVAQRAYIFGGGGHARVVASLLNADIVSVVPSNPSSDQIDEAAYFGRLDEVRRWPVYLGIGSNDVRATLLKRLSEHGIVPATCIAPTAFIAADAEIGAGTVICPGAVVNANAKIGRGAIVNTLAGVDHDCELGDLVQLAPGVSLGGTVRIGPNGFLGIKSAVFPGVSIGCNVKVMGGSLVTKPVPDNVQVGGIPARIVKVFGKDEG